MVSFSRGREYTPGKLLCAFFLLLSALQWSLYAIEANITTQGLTPALEALPPLPLLTRALPDGKCSATEQCSTWACCNKNT